MSKRIFSFLQYIVFLGIGIFLVWWQFHKMTPDELEKFRFALSDANYWMIIPVIFMSLASHLSRSMRWKILMEPMGYTPSLFNTFGSTMVGYLANSFVPRLGEILKCTLLGKYENIPVQKLIGTIVIERIFDFTCFLIFIVLTVVIQFKLVGNFVEENISVLVNNKSGFAFWGKMLMYVVALILLIYTIRWAFRKYDQTNLVKRIRNFNHGLVEGVASIKNLKKRKWFLFHTFFIWSMYLLQIYVGFSAIKEVSHLGMHAACSVLTLATLAMIVTPGGLGTFPTAIFLVLELYDVEESIGEAFGWLMWGTTTFIILIFGLLFLGLLFYVNKKKSEVEAPL